MRCGASLNLFYQSGVTEIDPGMPHGTDINFGLLYSRRLNHRSIYIVRSRGA